MEREWKLDKEKFTPEVLTALIVALGAIQSELPDNESAKWLDLENAKLALDSLKD